MMLATPAVGASDSAVILQYHHVSSDTPASTSVSPERFTEHVEYLDNQGFAVWPVDRIVEDLRHGRPLPQDCVAITFDDAYRSVYGNAFPLLRAKGWPFTVFVTTEGVDDGRESYLTWDQMREMARFGADFGNHSHSHAFLVRRHDGESEDGWRGRVSGDITRCQRRLREELGVEPRGFAYPYGEYTAALESLVVSLDLVGYGQHSGPVGRGSNFAALPRFPMAASFAEMESFVLKVRTLPLPVIAAEPSDPVLSMLEMRPVLRLTLAPGKYREEALAAYASGQGRIEARWVDREERILEIVAPAPLPAGRSRYNCTAPAREGGRYYWYSHLWIRGESHAG